MFTASVAIRIVEAGIVAPIEPPPEDRVCQLTSTRPLRLVIKKIGDE